MEFVYRAPDFTAEPLASATPARFEPAPADGVLPEGFFATTNLPTYVHIAGQWRLPRHPRMDGAIVIDDDGSLAIREGRYVRAAQPVAIGRAEDGSEGIFVHSNAFTEGAGADEFQFMRSEVSREKPVDYPLLARLMIDERARRGHIVWVVGPAILHAGGRDTLTWFVDNGFVGALLGGNAIAVHDIEQALMGTTLGMDRAGRPVPGGHSFHMRAINQIAAAGSIPDAVQQGVLTKGILHACVKNGVPFVLAGSIRDDGPLPDTIRDIARAQEIMREHATRATMAVMIATALHSIAFGNMLPAYVDEGEGRLRPLATVAVDSSEFVVSKLKDRGTNQAFGVITNAQDFLHVLQHFVETQLGAAPPGDPAASTHDARATESVGS